MHDAMELSRPTMCGLSSQYGRVLTRRKTFRRRSNFGHPFVITCSRLASQQNLTKYYKYLTLPSANCNICSRTSIAEPSSQMPDVVFKNDMDHPVHIGIWAVWLHCYTNALAPGASWTVHLAGIPYTIEIRAGDTDTHFHDGTSGEALNKIGNAYAQGTASVLTAVGWGLGMIGLGGPVARMASGHFTTQAL
ncbi:hypothetical protein BDY19DRAFT_1047591 [Irpex rosettiformis]|uniref:Uncharacterized protein n=1 Tax=Irpex rosettiformis TaxID=378272 RepID=A0ACB8U922_9APHY|nr:hypothetical protein BDY19DRAFT_1047591 [Irpex rosettiformis]